jgi:hypothetical protein
MRVHCRIKQTTPAIGRPMVKKVSHGRIKEIIRRIRFSFSAPVYARRRSGSGPSSLRRPFRPFCSVVFRAVQAASQRERRDPDSLFRTVTTYFRSGWLHTLYREAAQDLSPRRGSALRLHRAIRLQPATHLCFASLRLARSDLRCRFAHPPGRACAAFSRSCARAYPSTLISFGPLRSKCSSRLRFLSVADGFLDAPGTGGRDAFPNWIRLSRVARQILWSVLISRPKQFDRCAQQGAKLDAFPRLPIMLVRVGGHPVLKVNPSTQGSRFRRDMPAGTPRLIQLARTEKRGGTHA